METIVNKKILPIFRMGETDFYVDSAAGQFREVGNEENVISMDEIRQMTEASTELAFDCHTRNIYESILDPDNIPAHVIMVIVPPLQKLDPLGYTKKQEPANNYIRQPIGDQPGMKKPLKHNRHRL